MAKPSKPSKPLTSSKSATNKTKAQSNDIMTDDESDSESLYQKKLKNQQKNTKELFKYVSNVENIITTYISLEKSNQIPTFHSPVHVPQIQLSNA